jgi:hypothetical protein
MKPEMPSPEAFPISVPNGKRTIRRRNRPVKVKVSGKPGSRSAL